MHRSASLSRASDESFLLMAPQQMKGTHVMGRQMEMGQLLTYDPLSDVSKKEMVSIGTKAAERAIHVIPLVLFLCALILWSFSHLVDVGNKDALIVVRSVEAKITFHANQILPDPGMINDSDETNQIECGEAARALEETSH